MKLFNFEINIDKQNIAAFFSNRKRNIILIVLAALFVINLILGAVSEHIVALMPEMNGADVLEQIRETQRLHDLPVVFLTGTEDKENVKKAEQLHPEGFLLKTMGKKGLLMGVATFFR